MGLFKTKHFKTQRVYRAECINSKENVVQTVSYKDNKHDKCIVCLCMANKTILKSFTNRWGAQNQMKENRNQYENKK